MIIPLLIAGGLIAAFVAVSKREEGKVAALGIPPTGSVWTFVLKITPTPSQTDINNAMTAFSTALTASGVEVVNINSPDPSHIVATLRFVTPQTLPVMGVGTSMKIGPYTMTVESLVQAPSY